MDVSSISLSSQRVTLILLLLFLTGLLVWDIFLATNHAAGDTISAVIHRYGTQSWFVLIGMGVLIGHFFWPIQDGRITPDQCDDLEEQRP